MSFRSELQRASLVLVPLAAVLLGAAAGATADPAAVANEFVSRLSEALVEGPLAQDRLWAPGARDSTQRLLGARAAALFRWSDVDVTVERARHGTFVSPEVATGQVSECVDVELLVRGTATWEPQAYGVAKALWALQLDEEREVNPIVRREAWRLVPVQGEWLARERVLLSPVEVISVRIAAAVYPEQDALLVDCSYYIRSLADGVRALRFLLDRRAYVYGLLVDGESALCARGGELGSFGLEGFSPEVESSLRFPQPLAEGEESLVRFRIRSPLVHMQGDSFVSSLPFHAGAFRERAWYPLPGAVTVCGRQAFTGGELVVRWPEGEFEHFALSGEPVGAGQDGREGGTYEESFASSRWSEGDSRDAEFLLLESGVSPRSFAWSEIDAADTDPFARSLLLAERRVRQSGAALGAQGETPPEVLASHLDPHARSRLRIIAPLVAVSTYSSQDLTSELHDLLPLDSDLLDEMFDKGSTDADEGSDERSER